MILTHFHADHVQGLEGAMNGRKIDQVWVSTNSQPLSESTRVDELIGDIPKIRPAPRIILGGPGWRKSSRKSVVRVDCLDSAITEITRAVGA